MKLSEWEIETLSCILSEYKFNNEIGDKETIDKLKSLLHCENIPILDIEINYIKPFSKGKCIQARDCEVCKYWNGGKNYTECYKYKENINNDRT